MDEYFKITNTLKLNVSQNGVVISVKKNQN